MAELLVSLHVYQQSGVTSAALHDLRCAACCFAAYVVRLLACHG